MAAFFLLGKYSSGALKGANAARTRKAEQLIGRAQGKIKSMYALLGEYDLAMVVELPGVEEAMKVSAGLTKLTGIAFISFPAISVNDFDKLLQEI